MSAPDFLNDALKRWFSAPLGLADNDQAKTLRLKQARNVQRFRLGRPYSSAKVQFRKKPTTDVLVGHLFCFVQGPQRRVCIINLRTAEETFVGSPRPIENMHASNEILAFSGFKKCYVRSTSTDDAECKEFRIPGVGRTRSLTCSGRTVAYSYTTYSDQQPYHMNIYLFDYDSGRGHSFCPPFPEIAPEYAHLDWETHEVVLLDSRSRTVAVFYDNTSDDFSSLVYYVLCSFAGDKISCGSIRLRGVKLECFDGPVVVDRKGTPAITISSYVDVEVRSSLHQRSDDRTGSYRQMFLICPPEPGKEEYILQEIELNTMVCAFEERIGYWNGVVYKGIGCKQGPAAFCLRAGKWEKMDVRMLQHNIQSLASAF